MDAYIRGGARPKGRVRVSGAKNSATRLLAAALLTDEPVVLRNFPTHLVDANHKIRFIQELGGLVDVDHDRGTITVQAKGMVPKPLESYDFPIRTTYLLTAAQIMRGGMARIPYPGGCKIGSRGYDLHMMVWRNLGCEVTEKPEHIEVRGEKFKGGLINFPISTVGGTENALICAAVAEGQTSIVNAYVTPEIGDLIKLLRAMGASVELIGTSRIEVQGRARLSGANMDVMPDRVEALTWIAYGLISRGDLLIESVPLETMGVPIQHMEAMGVDLLRSSSAVYVHPDCVAAGGLQPFELACGTHPGVISDMQPFFVLLGLAAEGISRIYDYRYPERIAYVHELQKFCGSGAISAEPGKITTHGPGRFKGADAVSSDLRGSMALVMAALCAEGDSVVRGAHMAMRGYNNLEGKLKALGLDIRVQSSED